MTEESGEQRLRRKLLSLRPGKTTMIAASYRVKRNKENPPLFSLKAPNEGWSHMMPIDEMITFIVKDHYLNPDELW
ncbi:MAG: hypothetical protein WB554_12060 [Desulfomonilaceae bacterium]